MKRFSSTLVGSLVVFHGYDDQDYLAYVERLGHGVAKVSYFVPGQGSNRIVAYVVDPKRLDHQA